MTTIPKLDPIAFGNRKAVKMLLFVCLSVFALSVAFIVWAELNWDEFSSYEDVGVLRRKMRTTGWAPTVQGFGIWGIILSSILGFFGFFTTDFKNPTYGLNMDGLFINHMWYKRVFLRWNQIAGMKEGGLGSTGINVRVYTPEDVVSQISGKFRKNMAQKQLEMTKSINIGKMPEGYDEFKKALFERYENYQSENSAPQATKE
jgi:hypothetical protein